MKVVSAAIYAPGDCTEQRRSAPWPGDHHRLCRVRFRRDMVGLPEIWGPGEAVRGERVMSMHTVTGCKVGLRTRAVVLIGRAFDMSSEGEHLAR